ncbi:hypothetical protein G5B88_03950 [Herbaspirillum seropedicae]|uniref:Uncharacterized protein n=2 Tax=Herbaspirillum seropedicae TaxID=964 RepID=D8IZI2_HERSS|nr:hypothetical protein Hsero_0783 [Herbaspirillum seropedicae SmR1]AKN64452.1 hypothetical protein ACP92_03920 [Herbaspirillum seropedicae]NQE31156.1 hypothetical protein [Herbaspirillum seropedicae]UMU20376.1 hypothetical protein G5B88_03950 [Herbaspirillum seropedicae]
MKELIMRLIGEARIQQAVAMSHVDNGMHVFAYPQEAGMLIALGVSAEAPMRPEDILRRRGAELRLFGGWLPALFNDGGIYVVRRLSSEEEEGGDELDSQLEAALELLN